MRNPGQYTQTPILLLAATLLPTLCAQPQDLSNVEIQTLHVQGNVYMLVGGGGNVTVQAGNDGVLLVDTNFEPLAPKIMAAIRKLSSGPVRYVVLTHVHADHTGGTEALVKLGSTPAAPAAALVIAQLNFLNPRVPRGGGTPPVPQPLWPNDTYSAP